MSKGKLIGIIAFVFACLFVVDVLVIKFTVPEISQEDYELFYKDQEAGMEAFKETFENGSLGFRVAEKIMPVFTWGTLILSIVSLVMLSKNKEAGKKFPLLAILLLIIFLVVFVFSVANMGAAMDASVKVLQEQEQ